MRIERIECFAFHRRLDGSVWNPAWRWTERRAPLLRVVADDGAVGIGEGWTTPDGMAAFALALRHAAPRVLGIAASDPAAMRASLHGAPATGWPEAAAASALDIALWDLQARCAGVPLHRLLGALRDDLAVYASGGLYADGKTTAALAREMRGYAGRGFDAVKMKIGALAPADDLARVAAVRAAVGADVAIVADAVGQLDRAGAAVMVPALAALGVRAIQAPLASGDLDGMAAIQAGGLLDVVAGEAEFRPAALRALVDRRAVGELQVCVGLCGGFTGALALAAHGASAGLRVTPHCFSTAVMQAASFHLGAACDNLWRVEYHMFHDSLHAALPAGMTDVRAGRVRLDGGSGLGFDPARLLGMAADAGQLGLPLTLD